jgi:hypothetical protein
MDQGLRNAEINKTFEKPETALLHDIHTSGGIWISRSFSHKET